MVPAVEAAPEAAFHEAWVRALLREALIRVKAICQAKGQTEHLRIFAGRYLARSAVPPPWAELGAAFGLDGKTARSRAETVAYHLRAALAEMVARETGSGESVNQEIASLLALF
jgi:hypothetical protein